jgi:hypothetical protein
VRSQVTGNLSALAALTAVSRGSFLNTRNDQLVVDCAYGYQKENQEEADEVEDDEGG